MRKILLLLLAFVSLTLTLKAQTQSLEDMKFQLEQTDTLYEAEKYDEVLEICLSIGRSTERCGSEQERTVYVRSQILACRCYDQLERYQEGYELSKRLMATQLTDEEKKELSDAYVNSAYFLAVPMMKGKNTDYGKARALLEEVLPYANENDWTIVMNKIGASWYFEGSVYYRNQDYDKTKECARRGVEVFRKTGKVSDEIATLNLLADAYYYQYDLSSAMETYRYALSQAKEAGETDLQMNVLSDIWRLCNLIGDVQMAQECNVAMDSLAEQTTDEVSKMTYYNLQAEKAMRQGNYRVAEQWLFRSVSLAEASTSGKLGSLAGIPYFKLSELYLKAGRYDDCIAYAKKYMEPPHEEMSAVGLYRFMGYGQFMAEAYRYKGDKAGCYEAVDTLFLLLPYLSDPEVINYLYIRRGFCRAAFGDHEAALADYQKADEILATKYKPSDQCRVQLLAFLTRQFHAVGRDAEAEQCSRKNLAYTKELNGENSLQYIESQIRLAQAEEWSGMIVQGCQDYLQAEERLERWVRDRLPYMDANERKGFWSPLSELFTLMTPYALKAGELQTAFTRGCYDALVMSKAFLLDSERSLYDIIKREGTDEDMRQYMSIVAMKQQMKGWEKDYQQNADRILEASKQLEVMGRGLQARVRGYGNNTEFMDVDHEAVRQSLHKDETLIDFTDYETKPSGRHYAAYIVRQEQQYPLLMPLFDECQIDSLCIPQPYLYYDQEYSPAILQLLWTPLASQLHEGQTVYYVPSQLLFNIALESIPLADGTLLGDHYRFIRLSSARELVRMRKADTVAKERTAVLYGGLQYDVASTTMQGEAEKSGQYPFPLAEEDVVCGGGIFAYLPGSEEAIRKVERILGEHHWKVCTYTGAEGTEESFLAMNAHSPRILQLYTHGFYYTPDRASSIDYLKGFTDAMQLSGIVLSGGNAAWTGKELPDGARGGILTAGTIAGMDLSGTELAVLSACQTGLGKATPEGLYGLQRAFKKAGVGTVVMSLWEISNNVSQEFMTIFYERLMAQNGGWDKQKAFRETKAIIRARHPEPYYWAAFVMLDGCF